MKYIANILILGDKMVERIEKFVYDDEEGLPEFATVMNLRISGPKRGTPFKDAGKVKKIREHTIG